MRVAVVHNFHSPHVPSGEDAVVRAEVAALQAAGVEVELVAVDPETMGSNAVRSARGALTVATGLGVSPLDAIERAAPDVVHVHNLFPFVGRRWLRKVQPPIVVTAHSYRPLCANGYLYRDGHVCTLCPDGQRWSGVRYGCYRSPVATLPLAWAGRRGAGRDALLAAASRVLVLSERAASLYRDAGVDEQRLERDSHFVPSAYAAPAPAGPTGSERWVYAGRLTPEKGIEELIAVWPAGRRLVVVGDGPLRPRLEAASAGRPIEFRGSLDRPDVVAEMAGAVGVVVPSRWFETFGLVAIEALAVGTPVLAFEPNVVADAVLEDGTGLVTTWDDVPGALARAAAAFPALRDECRRVFEARYSEPAWLKRRLALYERLLST